jgi:Flp pilus assembly protein TadG
VTGRDEPVSRRVPADDEGSVLVLVIGLVVILCALVLMVIDVSIVALSRRAVSSAADGAAVSAAQGVDEAAYGRRGAQDFAPLSEALVADRVAAYADRAERGQPGLVLTGRVEAGSTVVVTARRQLTLPFSGWLAVGTVTVTAESRARASLTP